MADGNRCQGKSHVGETQEYFHYSFQVEDSSDVLLRAQKGHKNVRTFVNSFYC